MFGFPSLKEALFRNIPAKKRWKISNGWSSNGIKGRLVFGSIAVINKPRYMTAIAKIKIMNYASQIEAREFKVIL